MVARAVTAQATEWSDLVLPYLTADIAGIGGRLRVALDDFRVEEIAAYPPSGEGDHLFLRIEKRDMSTPFAVDRIARALKISARDIGYAGMKDRHAVTEQTLSVPGRVGEAAVEALAIEGLTVRSVARHQNKLRIGHLRGNRFTLRLRQLDDLDSCYQRAIAVASVLQREGVPNFYGSQRFGREGDNATRARAWLVGGGPAPRDHTLRRLLASSLQSSVFNRWLSERLTAGLLARYVDGDLAARFGPNGEGRPWAVDPSEAEALYATGGVTATGPMPGPKMPRPTGEALAREEAVMAAMGLDDAVFARAGALAEGTRRAARVFVDGLDVSRGEGCLIFRFGLPSGGYATTVMREFCKVAAGGDEDAAEASESAT